MMIKTEEHTMAIPCKITASEAQLADIGIDHNLEDFKGTAVYNFPDGWYIVQVKIDGSTFEYDIPSDLLKFV